MYGVIDIGSNTIRLSFYRLAGGKIDPMMNKKEVAGLASYIKKNNKMSQEGIAKLIHVLEEYKQIVGKVDIREMFVFATASVRNVENEKEILKKVKDETGIKIRVLSGEDEGRLGYLGAMQCADIDDGLLVDIGGGSTELVFYKEKHVVASSSMPIGSLNLFNRYIGDILPTRKEVKTIKDTVLEEISKIYQPDLRLCAESVCGIGGTARTVCKIHNEMLHLPDTNMQFRSGFTRQVIKKLAENKKEMIHMILNVAPERIHTIIPGTIILGAIARYFESETVAVSRYGVREGYIYDILRSRGVMDG
ncbi:MAG: hypothetical protein ACOYJU_03280 [Anaerovoracaceae bacterium]